MNKLYKLKLTTRDLLKLYNKQISQLLLTIIAKIKWNELNLQPNTPSAKQRGFHFACLSFDRLSTSNSYSNCPIHHHKPHNLSNNWDVQFLMSINHLTLFPHSDSTISLLASKLKWNSWKKNKLYDEFYYYLYIFFIFFYIFMWNWMWNWIRVTEWN